jgi:magnesium chelatase family protein
MINKRNDLHVDVPSVETQKLVGKSPSASLRTSKRKNSKVIQKKVQEARDIQTRRFKRTNLPDVKTGIKSNAEMNTREVKKYCPLSPKCRTMMLSATASMS